MRRRTGDGLATQLEKVLVAKDEARRANRRREGAVLGRSHRRRRRARSDRSRRRAGGTTTKPATEACRIAHEREEREKEAN